MITSDRIIDRDVVFYAAEIDYCKQELARCFPRQERYWQNRLEYANKLYTALILYRGKVDAPYIL